VADENFADAGRSQVKGLLAAIGLLVGPGACVAGGVREQPPRPEQTVAVSPKCRLPADEGTWDPLQRVVWYAVEEVLRQRFTSATTWIPLSVGGGHVGLFAACLQKY